MGYPLSLVYGSSFLFQKTTILMAAAGQKIPVGLDFGTNHTVISVIERGSKTPTLVTTCNGEYLHETVVYYQKKKNQPPLFGKAALAKLPDKNVVLLAKRALGVTSKQISDRKMDNIFNAKIANPNKANMVHFYITVDGKEVKKSASEVVVDLLKHYKSLWSRFLEK